MTARTNVFTHLRGYLYGCDVPLFGRNQRVGASGYHGEVKYSCKPVRSNLAEFQPISQQPFHICCRLHICDTGRVREKPSRWSIRVCFFTIKSKFTIQYHFIVIWKIPSTCIFSSSELNQKLHWCLNFWKSLVLCKFYLNLQLSVIVTPNCPHATHCPPLICFYCYDFVFLNWNSAVGGISHHTFKFTSLRVFLSKWHEKRLFLAHCGHHQNVFKICLKLCKLLQLWSWNFAGGNVFKSTQWHIYALEHYSKCKFWNVYHTHWHWQSCLMYIWRLLAVKLRTRTFGALVTIRVSAFWTDSQNNIMYIGSSLPYG